MIYEKATREALRLGCRDRVKDLYRDASQKKRIGEIEAYGLILDLLTQAGMLDTDEWG